ncbi:MAG: hypothetical protein H7296_04815 [Bacteroidia bacterium]|nr:hypothetical protein [Bacteroidia bacterium]
MNEEEHDPAFTQSVKLMLFGGLLMLACIVGGNKLINFHSGTLSGDQIKKVNIFAQLQSPAFRINSYTELYLTWLFFVIISIGLVLVIHRLVKTWDH